MQIGMVTDKDTKFEINWQTYFTLIYREAKAKIIAAIGEQKASSALRDASDIISQSPAALQLRYLQTLSDVSAEKNSTILFPIPMQMFANFARKNNWNQIKKWGLETYKINCLK